MAITKLPCLAIESYDFGQCRWYIDAPSCIRKYEELIANEAFNRSTITRFELDVDDELNPDRVTEIVDAAMWHSDYTVLQRRHGTDKVFVDGSMVPSPSITH
jgi:hypothetical protein